MYDLVASSGEVANCSPLYTTHSPCSFQARGRMSSAHQMPVDTSKMMSWCTTASSSHHMSSDEVTSDRYLEIVFS